MQAPALHPRERERLIDLDTTGLLDTAPESEFDGLATLAATVTGCPVALICLVDEDRAWFKARHGTDLAEVPRETSFSAHAILSPDPLVVEDATRDPRFVGNPEVTGTPPFVFYAGVPVHTGPSHLPVGVLCAIDHAPRTLTASQLAALQALARQVEVLVEHRRREQDLADLVRRVRSSDERVQAVVTAMHDGAVMQLANGAIIWHNRAAERILGLSSDQLTGRTSMDPRWRAVREDGSPLPGPEHPAMVGLRSGEPQRGVVMGVGVGEQLRWINVNAEPLWHVGEPKPWAVVTSFTDFTELRTREAELVAARDAAESASRAKADFLATMSHELRTPMNGVIGMTELLLAGTHPPEQREMLQAVHDSGRSLLSIINDILDFSKLEAGARLLQLVPFSVEHVANEALRPLRLDAERKALTLRVEVPRYLGALGDPDAVRQVLINLVGNALKFTTHGEVALLIARDGERCVFQVKDTGIGIDAEHRARLFQRFSQADASTSRRFGGTGLGLAISQRLVKAMGGEITVDSSPGNGSTFSFQLSSAACPPTRVVEVAALSAGARLRVLLVEDNPINQKVAASMLARLGHEVELARDGFEGVAAASRGPFDLVLMDVQMPGMDGLEATRRIRELPGWRGRRIVALTASVMKHEQQACLDAGMDAVLPKPLTLRALTHMLTTGEAAA